VTTYAGSGGRLPARTGGLDPALVHGETGPTPLRELAEMDPARRPGYRPDIEGLRAVAILLVVAYHCDLTWARGGFVGVDVFFVISGYLITTQLTREAVTTGALSIGRFYARRVMRLLPAASLSLAATLLAAWWWLPATRIEPLARDVLAADVYGLNYRLAITGSEYRTAGQAPSAVQHFWSLGVEEQFYLVIPVLLLVTLVGARRRGLFTAALALITAVSLYWSVTTSAASPTWAYFSIASRAWELGAGALLALGASALPAARTEQPGLPFPVRFGLVLRWGGLAAIGYAAWSMDSGTVFPGRAALLPVLGAVAVIAGGVLEPATRGLGSLPMREIGARSYSWYLWHWPFLVIAPFVVHHRLTTSEKIMTVLLALVVAGITYAAVERPLHLHPLFRHQPLRAAGLGVALTAVIAALALAVPHLPPHTKLGLGKAQSVQLGSGKPSARAKALSKQLTRASRVSDLPENLQPSLRKAAADDPAIAADACLVGFTGTTTPRHCENFGDPGAKRTLVLFGDSHAGQWFPALNAQAKQKHWRLAVFAKVVCVAADVEIYLDPQRGGYDECVTWRKRSIARIGALHPKLIMMSSKADGGDAIGLSGDQDKAWAEKLTVTISKLRRPGTRLVYLNDTPVMKSDVPECLAEHPRAVQRCAQTRKAGTGSERRAKLAEAAADAGATVIDPTAWFCTATTCPAVVGDTLVYKDSNHISTKWSKLLGPLLAERLRL
jgi:peptidoglycan/LPS O-acetylase OafA/YrhL